MKNLFRRVYLGAALVVLTAVSPVIAANTHTNSIGMEFVLLPAGSFLMGCGSKAEDCSSIEKPRHRVTLTRPFYLGRYEVTQAQWAAVMGSNPSKVQRPDNPVENVSWDDVQEFIRRLNQKEPGKVYRLPTEAEWEYAARAGTKTAYCYGNNEEKLDAYAWNSEYVEGGTNGAHPVGRKKPNAWGLYDMHGNVAEWVQDGHKPGLDYYAESPEKDPQGPQESAYRMTRGGSWASPPSDCRSAARLGEKPGQRLEYVGFRLALWPAP